MRKHSVRKWLHAILDLLPVIILPIFAVYSHRHTIDNYEVTRQERTYYESNDVSTYTDLIVGNAYHYGDNLQSGDVTEFVNFGITCDIDVFKLQFPQYQNESITNLIFYLDTNLSVYYSISYADGRDSYFNVDAIESDIGIKGISNASNIPSVILSKFTYCSNRYFKEFVNVTYDNTDIGSQMVYSLYKPINDYFNMNNVFNFGEIYQWFELNMFNGNAPLSIFIVWNIIVYEFIMDIIFLIYSVFMFVIDFACETLDRFTGWAKRGD